jgi:hypothetical protein
MTKPGAPDPLEVAIHTGVIDLLRFNARDDVVYFHVANERRAPDHEHAFLKRMGVLKGVLDFVLVIDGRAHFLEVKRPKTRPAPAQREFLKDAEKAGAVTAVVHSIKEAVGTLTAWGALKHNVKVAA